MHTFTLELGDGSGDGHCVTVTPTVVVDGEFTQKQLVENFEKNVKLFRYDPKVVDAGYDSTFPADLLLRVAEAGFTPGSEEGMHPFFMDWEDDEDITTVEDVRALVEAGTKITVTTDGLVAFLMFLMGYGLDGFSWKYENPKNFLELAPSTKNYNIGYGVLNPNP